MRVKKELAKRLERFLSEYPSSEEKGGFLLRNRRGVVAEFLPTPNTSTTPKTQFLPVRGSLQLARMFAHSRRMVVEAFFHSHPDPCVMSVADVSAAGNLYNELTFVMISPTQEWAREYLWYACIGIRPVKIELV